MIVHFNLVIGGLPTALSSVNFLLCPFFLFFFFAMLLARQFSLDRNFLHWSSLYAWLFKCMLVHFMWLKFVYEKRKTLEEIPSCWMLEFREQFFHLLKWPTVLCVIFPNQNFSLHALVRVLPQVLFFSATHALELFDSSTLNRCSNMIYFHYASVKNSLLFANVKEYSMASSKQIRLKCLWCSCDVIIFSFFHLKKHKH